MSVTSWKAPASASNVAGIGSVAWTNPSYILSDDTNYTGPTSMAPGSISNWLRVYWGFTSSDVPSGATIDGIELRITKYYTVIEDTADNALRLVIGGSIGGTDVSDMTTVRWDSGAGSNGEYNEDYGGSSNLWSSSPTQSDVTGASFGVAYAIKNIHASKTYTPDVDWMQMRIYYTAGLGADVWLPPVNVTSGSSQAAAIAAQGSRKVQFSSY